MRQYGTIRVIVGELQRRLDVEPKGQTVDRQLSRVSRNVAALERLSDRDEWGTETPTGSCYADTGVLKTPWKCPKEMQ